MPQPWLESMQVPARPAPADLRAFFGVPPDPEEELDANIAMKRRHWSTKTRVRKPTEAARRKVEGATRIIDELAKLLKRGVIDEDFDLERLREEFMAEPETRVGELDDLWRVLEELLAAGHLDEALRVANEARTRFRGAPSADAAFGWVASIASRAGETATDLLRREGRSALEAAIAGGAADADLFRAKAQLEVDLGLAEEALDTFAAATETLGGDLTPWMYSGRCEAYAALGRPEEALADARHAIPPGTEDPALRSATVAALITAVRVGLLPITGKEGLRRYQELVEWAAWFAEGTPEAEDRIRPYRLWAVEAESLAYTGRHELRTIAAVASGFLLLPVLNRFKTKPHWQVLLEGPKQGESGMFEVVFLAGIPQYVHKDLLAELPWYAEFIKAQARA